MTDSARPTPEPGQAAPVLFLDRDGTMIEEVNYLSRLEQIRLLPGTARAVRAANEAGLKVIVITNQSGVARGYFSEDFVRESAGHLGELLGQEGARLDGHYFCPHHPSGNPPYNIDCPDRKPGAGLLLQAAREHGLLLQGAYMVGDKSSDLEAGAELGVVPLLVRTGYGSRTEEELPPGFQQRGGRIFDDLAGAVEWILSELSG
ncbi:MAG: HAD family hydrolase [Deltaproteobacteria bacterium]|nr:HAD family hydrolase [Deltaproteobacteria bacterium]